jgi:hypothetical protein
LKNTFAVFLDTEEAHFNYDDFDKIIAKTGTSTFRYVSNLSKGVFIVILTDGYIGNDVAMRQLVSAIRHCKPVSFLKISKLIIS